MSRVCHSLDDDDRISNLPLVLKHFILDLVPLNDAVRTSTLSKAWRTTWKTKHILALDKLFFLEVISKKNEAAYLSAFSDLVDMILSVHTGPVVDIKIYIPPKLHNHHISRWIENLPKQDVTVLRLDNSENDACLIPSHFFGFSKLKRLRLNKWILSPPHADVCFANLENVCLFRVSISARISFRTKLQNLDLHRCTGIEHLDFTKSKYLKRLFINFSSKIDWRWWLENTKQMELLILAVPAADVNMSNSVNLIRLLSNCPNIKALVLHNFTIESLRPDPSEVKTLTTKMVNLKRLHLYRFRYNWCQISNSLFLIRYLPNQQELRVTLNFLKSANPENPTIECHLESLDWKDVVLDQLLTVEICEVVGLRSVHQLTRILLASSPSLRKMSLFCSATVSDPDEKSRIKRELLQLP